MTSANTPPSPVVAEVALDADLTAGPGAWTWTDCNRWVLVDQPITITHGRDDQYSAVSHTNVSVLLNNKDGRWSESNPTGPWYGRVRQGTPMRFTAASAARPVVVSDTFTRVVVNGLGDTETGEVWQLIGTVGVTFADFQVTGSAATISVSAANGYQLTRVDAPVDCELSTQVSFPLPTGGPLETGLTLREGDAFDYYRAYVSVAAGTNAVTAFIGTSVPVATLATAPTGLIHAAGTPLKMRARVDGTTIYFRVWQGTVEPTNWTVSATSTACTQAGLCGMRTGRAAGNTNAPAVFTYDNFVITQRADLGCVYLDELPTEWDSNAGDFSTVPVRASGLFRQLGQGDDVVAPLVRSWTAEHRPLPVAYWPMDDGDGATSFAALTDGIAPAPAAGDLNFAADTTLPGSGPMPTLGSASTIEGVSGLPATAAPQAGLRWVTKIPTAPVADAPIMHWETPGGTVRGWIVRTAIVYDPDAYQVEGYDAAGNLVVSAFATFGFTYGRHAMWRFNATQNGANIDWTVDCYTYDDTYDSLLGTTAAGSLVGTVGNITRWYTVYGQSGWSLGHVAVVTDTAHGPSDEAPWGYPGETDTDRIAAVCAEAGIPCKVFAEDVGVPLGPRPLANSLAILRDAEAAGDGILVERQFGVAYVALSARYNRTPALTVDNRLKQIADLKTANDDQGRRNDVTVTRTNGGKARAQDMAHIARYRRYREPLTLNLAEDTQTADAAFGRVVQGTVDGDRVPKLVIDLYAHPELLNAFIASRVGSLIRVKGAPYPLPPDDLDLELQGWKVTADGYVMTVEMNTSRADPWQPGILDGGRLDSDATTLTASLTATGLSFQATITDGSLWTTDPAQFPMVIRMGGEDIRLSGITGAASPQTCTVAAGGRGYNGVVKAHTAGTPIHPRDRIRLAR